ncbi:hypothetical protein EV589_5993 [Mycobacterium sp. BK558]|jgi:hypothetical protein|nr:hypothetical protein EV589_5993 [Mycobacterium sp. BK558]
MSSCESALVEALTRPVAEPVPVAVLNWVLTGAWARPAMPFDIAHARPGWSDPLAL